MSTNTRRRLVKERWAHKLAQESLKRAPKPGGTYADVGRALPVPLTASAVAHDVTDRVHPDLRSAFQLLFGLAGSVDTVSARAFAECAEQAVDAREILESPKETLIDRGFFLLRDRQRCNAEECAACEADLPSFPDDLRAESWEQLELAIIIEVLRDVHDVDLVALYDARGCAA